MKKVTAVVPMKLNNRRLPQKNTKSFTNGKPLCYYILSTLLKIEGIDDVYVYCSNPAIQSFIPEGVNFLQRDEYLDQSTTSFNEVLEYFARDVEADIYLLTHATAPFLTKESFEKGIAAVKSGGYDSALTVEKLQEFLWKDGKPFNYNLSSIPRTQDLEPYFKETCGMYVYTAELIKNEGRRIGHKPFLIEVSKVEACDINNLEDFMLADAIAMSRDK